MFVLYLLTGLVGGILGGMGMGGGTLLIPLLNIFFNLNQQVSQAINLISFIPMAIVALIIHFKNGLVKIKGVILIVLSGLALSFVGTLIAKNIESHLLKRIFGGFLIVLSIFQFISAIKSKDKK